MTGWQPVKRRASQIAESKPRFHLPATAHRPLWLTGSLGYGRRVKHEISHQSIHNTIGKTLALKLLQSD